MGLCHTSCYHFKKWNFFHIGWIPENNASNNNNINLTYLFIYLSRLLLKEECSWHMQPKQYTGIWTYYSTLEDKIIFLSLQHFFLLLFF